jgi:pimeloyl-ACP methyl ester carboxylesterase
MLLASARPDLVDSLILVEAGPAGPSPELPVRIAAWLDSWPIPFKSQEEATAFLGHEAWARGLERRRDGWYPRTDRDTMIDSVGELAANAYWTQWSQIRCPTLLIQGENGTMRPDEPTAMLAARPATARTVIRDASHDVHLDRPEVLCEAIVSFLKERLPDP